jgi:hypothetical protein
VYGVGCGAAADYNGDGKPDLAVCTPKGITILLGTGKATSPYVTGATIPVGNEYFFALLAVDLNGDGIPDLLASVTNDGGATGTVFAFLGNGDGTFRQTSSIAIPGAASMTAGDFNGDGKLDFAVTGNLLALGNGDGTFQTPAPFLDSPAYLSSIAAGDLNGDGFSDLVLSGSSPPNTVYVLINNQHGGFTQSVIDVSYPGGIVLADLNGDGKLDVVIADALLGGAYIYIGDGQGGLTFKESLQVFDYPSFPGTFGDIMVADLNGDGVPDIAMIDIGSVAIFLGEGDAEYRKPFYVGVGLAPGLLAANVHGQPPAAGLPDIVSPDGTGGVLVLINTTQ